MSNCLEPPFTTGALVTSSTLLTDVESMVPNWTGPDDVPLTVGAVVLYKYCLSDGLNSFGRPGDGGSAAFLPAGLKLMGGGHC